MNEKNVMTVGELRELLKKAPSDSIVVMAIGPGEDLAFPAGLASWVDEIFVHSGNELTGHLLDPQEGETPGVLDHAEKCAVIWPVDPSWEPEIDPSLEEQELDFIPRKMSDYQFVSMTVGDKIVIYFDNGEGPYSKGFYWQVCFRGCRSMANSDPQGPFNTSRNAEINAKRRAILTDV